MLQSAAKTKTPPTAEEKTLALEQVLSSRTFHRSDLLIKFVKYVCERELAGQADQITEYSIATEALGRPGDFAPEADSSVRSRAHALRRKLEDCYREELQDASVRIVLPKGSYVPEFVVAGTNAEAPAPPAEVATSTGISRSDGRLYLFCLLAFVLGVGATLLATSLLRQPLPNAGRVATPESLRQAWGPLLTPNAEVLVVVGIPKQFWARDFTGLGTPRNEVWYPKLPQDQPLNNWFFDNKPPSEQHFILLHPNVGSPLWGDVAGALGAVRTLAAYGVKHQVLPERVLKPYALRGRNVLLFGNPEYSPAIRQFVQDAPFRVEYDTESHWEAVVNHKPLPGEPAAFRRSSGDDNFGVITVIAEERDETRSSQIVIFSGLTSAGTQAAEEFFSSPADLGDLQRRFQAEGITRGSNAWPQSYQVVVEATTDINLPIRHRYRTHRVLVR